MLKAAIATTLVVLSVTAGFAQEDSLIGGHVESTIVVPSGWNDDYNYQTVSTELKLAVDHTGARAALNGELYFTVDDLAATGDITRKLSTRPGEIYLSLFPGPIDLTVGRQMIAWGSVDALSPTDIVNPLDLSDLSNLAATDTEDVRIPVTALRANLYPIDFLRLEGILLPVFT